MGGDLVVPAGALPEGITVGDDGVARCWWGAGDPLYRRYHDQEWGQPVADDRRLFEKLSLEGVPGRAQLADHPPQARALPAGV